MIILNFSEDIFKVEDFDFYVERVEDLDKNVLGIVDNTLETLFPNVTKHEWEKREFCVVAPCATGEDNGELLFVFTNCVARLSKVGYVKIFFTYLYKHPVAFYFR